MEVNTAKWDRILRAIAGIVLIGVAVLYNPTIGMIGSIIAGILGLVMLFVAITGFCWIYTLIGFKTLKDEPKAKEKVVAKKKKK